MISCQNVDRSHPPHKGILAPVVNDASGLARSATTVSNFSGNEGRVSCLWRKTDRTFEGYPGLIHGGVLAALLDEIMANALVRRLDLFGVTIKAEFEWLRAIKVGEEVCGSAMVTSRMGRLVKCEAYLTNIDQKVCVRSMGIFYLPTLDQFKKLTRIDSVPTEIHRYFKN